ncbi:hypothetical protein ACQ4LE_001527 [Meloidogyne hapla]
MLMGEEKFNNNGIEGMPPPTHMPIEENNSKMMMNKEMPKNVGVEELTMPKMMGGENKNNKTMEMMKEKND